MTEHVGLWVSNNELIYINYTTNWMFSVINAHKLWCSSSNNFSLRSNELSVELD